MWLTCAKSVWKNGIDIKPEQCQMLELVRPNRFVAVIEQILALIWIENKNVFVCFFLFFCDYNNEMWNVIIKKKIK